MAGAALNVGVTPVQIKEILCQSVPYVGMARAFDFLHATNEVLAARGILLPLAGQSTTTPETRYEITQLLPWVGYPRTLNVLKSLNEVAPAPPTGAKPL
jgi:hypothetical protein